MTIECSQSVHSIVLKPLTLSSYQPKVKNARKNFKNLLLFYFFNGNNFTGKAFDFG